MNLREYWLRWQAQYRVITTGLGFRLIVSFDRQNGPQNVRDLSHQYWRIDSDRINVDLARKIRPLPNGIYASQSDNRLPLENGGSDPEILLSPQVSNLSHP